MVILKRADGRNLPTYIYLHDWHCGVWLKNTAFSTSRTLLMYLLPFRQRIAYFKLYIVYESGLFVPYRSFEYRSIIGNLCVQIFRSFLFLPYSIVMLSLLDIILVNIQSSSSNVYHLNVSKGILIFYLV